MKYDRLNWCSVQSVGIVFQVYFYIVIKTLIIPVKSRMMTTIIPTAIGVSCKSRCNRIILRHLSNRRVQIFDYSNKKFLNVNVVRKKYKMNSYSTDKLLNLDNMNSAVKRLEYAVRGPLVIRAVEIQKELQEKVRSIIRFRVNF